MGGQSNMGGAATQQTQATPGLQSGGFDLSKLFMGNAPTSAGGGMPAAPLPQIQAPARPPMPVMPQRAPLPIAPPQMQNPFWYRDANGLLQQATSMTPDQAKASNRKTLHQNRERGRGGR